MTEFQHFPTIHPYPPSLEQLNSISREGSSCHLHVEYLLLSFCILVEMYRVKHDHFCSQIDRNFTFQLLMYGVAAGWPFIAHGTSIPARACPMVGSAGSTWLGCSHDRAAYFRFQSIIFHFRSNIGGSLDRCASRALPPTHLTYIM